MSYGTEAHSAVGRLVSETERMQRCLDAVTAERDALAAKVEELEKNNASLRMELTGLERYRISGNEHLLARAEAAEAKVVNLKVALNEVRDCLAQNVEDPDTVALAIVDAALADTPAKPANAPRTFTREEIEAAIDKAMGFASETWPKPDDEPSMAWVGAFNHKLDSLLGEKP